MKSAALLLASLGNVLEKIGREKAGVVALAVAFGLGGTSAVGALTLFGEYRGLPERVAAVEEWATAHEDTVSVPGLALAESNEQAVQGLRRDVAEIRSMVFELYCLQFPDRCEGRPAGSPGDG